MNKGGRIALEILGGILVPGVCCLRPCRVVYVRRLYRAEKRMTVCEKRIGELEMLIAKIYEDNALGKLSDKRYIMLYNQYEGEQERLQDEVNSYKAEQAQYENDRKSTARFLKLVERYAGAEEMSTVMLNEFVEKIIVHERDRKGSADTTRKIEVYFNFIGEYIPPTMAEKEPTPSTWDKAVMRKLDTFVADFCWIVGIGDLENIHYSRVSNAPMNL